MPAPRPPFQLEIDPPRLFTQTQVLDLARQASARKPESETLRIQLAAQLVELDQFDEAIRILEACPADTPVKHRLLASALLHRHQPADDPAALEAAQRYADLAPNPRGRSEALTLLARAQLRLRQVPEGRASLLQALALDPKNKDASKRLTTFELRAEGAAETLTVTENLLQAGIVNPIIFSAQQNALTHLGRLDEARKIQGLKEFLVELHPAPPAGWATLSAFNQALAEEIQAHPDLRSERHAKPGNQVWMIDQPSVRGASLVPQLQQLIAREVAAYAAALPAQDTHPFLRDRPLRGRLRNWCVIVEGEGHEDWHIHPGGWLSGVYYIQVPDHVAHGTGPGGCIAFGVPGEIVGQANSDAFGETLIRPSAGLMMIFPSHVYHRTFPHHGTGRRICFAFDVNPLRKDS